METDISPEKLKLYLETTITSYLTAKQSRDIIQSAHQQITIEWWKSQFHKQKRNRRDFKDPIVR